MDRPTDPDLISKWADTQLKLQMESARQALNQDTQRQTPFGTVPPNPTVLAAAQAAEMVLTTQDLMTKGIGAPIAEGMAMQQVTVSSDLNKIMGLADRVAKVEVGLNLATATPALGSRGPIPQVSHRETHELLKTLNTGSTVTTLAQEDLHNFTNWKKTIQMRIMFSQIDYNQNRGVINH